MKRSRSIPRKLGRLGAVGVERRFSFVIKRDETRGADRHRRRIERDEPFDVRAVARRQRLESRVRRGASVRVNQRLGAGDRGHEPAHGEGLRVRERARVTPSAWTRRPRQPPERLRATDPR